MLTLILKGTNSCNLRCRYCSLGDKSETQMMSEKAMDRAFAWFCCYAKERHEKKVTIILHGGEPMLLPAMHYDRVLERMLVQYPDLDFTFRIQTNGTILTEAYLKLFRKYAFHIGISLDGLAQIHDSQRRDLFGKGTYSLIVRNIRKLQRENLPVSVLMVLTKPSLHAGYEYLDFFASQGISVKINPLLKTGEALLHEELCLEPGDYAEYLIGLHKYALEHETVICISPLEELQQAIIQEIVPVGCTFHGPCSYKFICIDQEGVVYPCGRFADRHRYSLGNIYDGITKEGIVIQERLEARRGSELPEKCESCKYIKLCHAGCNAMTDEGISQPSVMCKDYLILFDYLSGDGLHKYKEYLIKKKQEIERALFLYG